MKKSIIYLAIAVLSLSGERAMANATEQDAAPTATELDTLKSVHVINNFADNNLINPETVFPRKTSVSIDRVIADDMAVIDTSRAEQSELQYPYITDIEIMQNNQIIDAEAPILQPLDFSIINTPSNGRQTVIKKPSFTAAL